MPIGGVVAALAPPALVATVAGRSAALTVFAAEFVAAYGALVIWNPKVKYLLTGVNEPTSVVQTCGGGCQTFPETQAGTVDAGDFYAEYHSHTTAHLSRVHASLSELGCARFIYLCGDSTLDNKHWFFRPFQTKKTQMHDPAFTAEAVNGYEHVLSPARMVKDVAYWLNRGANQRLGPHEVCTLMTSVEESTLDDRRQGLLRQDRFIRDHITEADYLIVSVGGNDIALDPSLRTAINMVLLTRSPDWMIRQRIAPGFRYFERMFHRQTEQLVSQVVAKRKPHTVLVCMLYFLDMQAGGSWADPTLQAMGYNSQPQKLQLIIKTLFEAIRDKGFTIPGMDASRVKPFGLFNVLDGTNTEDYEQRVEPSVSGGRKMADAFLDELGFQA